MLRILGKCLASNDSLQQLPGRYSSPQEYLEYTAGYGLVSVFTLSMLFPNGNEQKAIYTF